MFNWLWPRVFSERNIGYLVEKSRPMIVKVMTEESKEVIITLLEDEDIALGVTAYTDALYERYKSKTLGFIGGKQKGLNYEIEAAKPKLDIFDDEGNISLSQIAKMVLSGGFRGLGGGQSPQNAPQSGGGGGNAPNM